MSDDSLPPYTYTPGVTPHPVSDPAGHSYGRSAAEPIDPARLLDSPEYLRGIALFQAGYYWEAHEEWEAVWHAAGRRGQTADFLKGLIKLAAAGVKAREGNADGVRRHAKRAAELLTSAREQGSSISGDALAVLTEQAVSLAYSATTYPPLDHGRPVVLWPELAAGLGGL